MMKMLESFFKYVLQDPKVTVDQLVRHQLVTSVLQTASTLLRWTPGKIELIYMCAMPLHVTVSCESKCCKLERFALKEVS